MEAISDKDNVFIGSLKRVDYEGKIAIFALLGLLWNRPCRYLKTVFITLNTFFSLFLGFNLKIKESIHV